LHLSSDQPVPNLPQPLCNVLGFNL
jgi:hypothetical protein